MNFESERVAEGPTRLLLVEDYAPLAEATAEHLRNAGLTVWTVESGREALRAAIEFQPHVVLFDLNLPDMSGLDVARALRLNPDMKDALLAMLSAMSDTDLRRFQSAIPSDEVNLFLSKPLTEKKVACMLAALAMLRQAPHTTPEL
jgi:CheY-like chemotaxis protein